MTIKAYSMLSPFIFTSFSVSPSKAANLCQETPIAIDEPVNEVIVSLPARSLNTYIFMVVFIRR